MTPHEALAVLVAAREGVGFRRWDDVLGMLGPVYDANLLAGADQGEMAYLLGLASEGKGHWVFAHQYFTDAARLGSDKVRGEAATHLEAIGRRDKATEAEGGGVAPTEATTVLAAADDALGREAFGDALAHYRFVFDSGADDHSRQRAALGIGRACAYLGQLKEAGQYAGYVVDTADADLAGQARQLADWVHSQLEATQAEGDGVTVDEYTEAMSAGRDAFLAGSYDAAMAHWGAVLASPHVRGQDRAKAEFNAGLCTRMLDRDAEARVHFQAAADHGSPETAQRAADQLAKLDRFEAAEDLADQLDPD